MMNAYVANSVTLKSAQIGGSLITKNANFKGEVDFSGLKSKDIIE